MGEKRGRTEWQRKWLKKNALKRKREKETHKKKFLNETNKTLKWKQKERGGWRREGRGVVHIANARFVRCFERKRKAESRKIPPNFFCFVFGALMRSFTPSVRVQKGGESPTSLISPPNTKKKRSKTSKSKQKQKSKTERERERERQIPPLAMRDEPPARQNERRGRNYTILCILGLLSFLLSRSYAFSLSRSINF